MSELRHHFPNRWIRRPLIVVGLLLVVPYAFMAELIKEIGSAFVYAWLEVRINIEAARKDW